VPLPEGLAFDWECISRQMRLAGRLALPMTCHGSVTGRANPPRRMSRRGLSMAATMVCDASVSSAPSAPATRGGCFSGWEHSFHGAIEPGLLRAGMQRGSLASNPLAQWCCAVTLARPSAWNQTLRFFHWWLRSTSVLQDPVYESVTLFFAV